jgi:uncharacterized protein (DUF433 family)
MTQLDLKQTAPLMADEDGSVRIISSRVTLDSIVDEFKRGATAEQILEDFPSLTLREVYGVIAYYLEHTEAVEEYLRERAAAGEEMRRWIEEKLPTIELRESLRARRAQLMEASGSALNA